MKTIIGNWKMSVGTRESVALARGVIMALRGKKTLPEVVICPPYVAMSEVRKIIARSHVKLGAQNMFWEDSGAYTGEISSRMLTEVGVSYVILGHSERRAHLGETDEMINKKVRAALKSNFVPVVCVGETKEQRKQGKAEDIVASQLHECLSGIELRSNNKLFVAYEPVWAIGTGESATPKDAAKMHAFIREHANLPVSVLYGGSVDGNNAYSFLREKEVDGILVGSASVKMQQFKDILDSAIEVLSSQED